MIPIPLTEIEIERSKAISYDLCKKEDHKHITQIESEMVVCKFFGLNLNKSFYKAVFKHFDIKSYDSDVNNIEIRFIMHEDDDIILYETDNKNSVFVIVSIFFRPNFIICGWDTGKKLMKNKYLEKYHDGSSRYVIPSSILNSMVDFEKYKKVK